MVTFGQLSDRPRHVIAAPPSSVLTVLTPGRPPPPPSHLFVTARHVDSQPQLPLPGPYLTGISQSAQKYKHVRLYALCSANGRGGKEEKQYVKSPLSSIKHPPLPPPPPPPPPLPDVRSAPHRTTLANLGPYLFLSQSPDNPTLTHLVAWLELIKTCTWL